MDMRRKETIKVRIISTCFVVFALAIFKPFGLEAWKWEACVHLLAMLLMGLATCMLTEILMDYVFRFPRPQEHDVSALIRHNLWFQLINTPLVSLFICLYRHFAMSDRVESNVLSLSNYIETLLIIGFCSFAIGLYWRFKYRSSFLATELEETRLLNEQLKKIQDQKPAQQSQPQPCPVKEEHREVPSVLTLSGTTNDSVTLQVSNLLYIEAVGNYVKVYQLNNGQVRSDMLRATSKQIEDDLRDYPMIVRCHRAFLVNLQQVEQVVSKSGSMQLVIQHSHDSIPVSRSNIAQVKEAIKGPCQT